MSAPVLLITPPFTQLNTPYPATAYLKGFLNTKGIAAVQADMGIEVTLALFCKLGLQRLFASIPANGDYSVNAKRIIALQNDYIQTIDAVISFLQGRNPTLAHLICKRNLLPEAGRFAQLDDLTYSFGTMGTQDKAKHLCTMYMEDLSDLIQECVDPHFGFSRYAERLGRSAHSFDEIHESLQAPLSFIDSLTVELLAERIAEVNPYMVAFSVPFPGNLFAAFRSAQWIKANYPHIKTAMGGGFPNTELRSLSDKRVFDYYDYITLDDGEAPIENLIAYLHGRLPVEQLKRTYTLHDGELIYFDNPSCQDYKQGQVGTPDYTGLPLENYISAIEVVNPMHSLWSDGRWNKLTMAHGCYWGKCTFCDVSLPYIKLYEPIAAQLLCDRMEELIAQTGETGFHFVDEAAPPALMRELALEIIRRKMVVSWWTNVRFEKAFTRDLCLLLKASGCIAVSGGLEVASDRLLQVIDKGITVAQVAKVNKHFTEAGIMVHAYLMYGYPTQTVQETIDSLEMVRQLFAAGILQSAFWHQFALTAHSPVGLNPEKYGVTITTQGIGSFANNDLEYTEATGIDHNMFSYGLKKSLHNYMHGACLDYPLHKWFDFKIPKTGIAPDYITDALQEENISSKPTTKLIFIGNEPAIEYYTKTKKGNSWNIAALHFETKTDTISIHIDAAQGKWLHGILPKLSVHNPIATTLQTVKESYEAAGLEDFELFWDNKPMNTIHKTGLLQL
ncbi:radical SAM protein [Chitinophagaceae bacterium IBVUCB1]|nr:radical SAM protein [Chitinophagaceae bacterium IBVUCB1]